MWDFVLGMLPLNKGTFFVRMLPTAFG